MRDYKDYKPQKKTNRKSSGRRLGPGFFKAILILIIVLAAAVGARYSYRWLLTADYFNLQEIMVTGEKRVEKEAIKKLSGARTGKNILAVNLKEMAERLESHPWIQTANIRRVLPRGLSIEVKEREPFAILKVDKFYYLDRGAKVIIELGNGDITGYPVITGFSKTEMEVDELAKDAVMKTFEFIETEAGNLSSVMPISEIIVQRNQGITVLSGNVAVKIGFGEYNIKTERLKRVLDDLEAKGKTAEYIDLTYSGQVVVR